jgi:hypothetical protein
MPHRVPADVLLRAAEIQSRGGIVGVFWGQKYLGDGRWSGELGTSVHVRDRLPPSFSTTKKKRDLEDRLGLDRVEAPPDLEEDLDVVNVGEASADALDYRDEVVMTDGPRPRRSSVSVVMRDGSSVYALVSGHGALPYDGRTIRSSLLESDGGRVPIQVNDADGTSYRGVVVSGRFGSRRRIDWALVRFDHVPEDRITTRHHAAADAFAPLPLRSDDLDLGEEVRHESRVLRATRRGHFRQMAASATEMYMPDATYDYYTGVLVVSGADGRFSDRGDSGSLVVDAAGRVVGTVLGSGLNGAVSYILPVQNLEGELGGRFWKFFRRSTE